MDRVIISGEMEGGMETRLGRLVDKLEIKVN